MQEACGCGALLIDSSNIREYACGPQPTSQIQNQVKPLAESYVGRSTAVNSDMLLNWW